ncbi:MAG: hypothetical protein J4F29_19105 [Candidatus Latescibacteria bacterium]|nr:hypothetical protein [Candidatus Latescibacterota bacterium]
MRIFLTIVVGISLMTLASGTVAYILHDPTFGGGLGLAAAWATMAFIGFFTVVETFEQERRKKLKKDNNQSEKLSKRVKELEKRLTDLQDIVITNDDKLDRLNNQSSVAPSPSPQTISD